MSNEIKFVTDVGRLVSGHPMKFNAVKDNKGVPKLSKTDGKPMQEIYFAIAVLKSGGIDWKQTTWGALIVQAAVAGWPNGEYQSPSFAWKIIDGDSAIPNKVGKKPCNREGWPGHWVLSVKSMFAFSCYHHGKYNPLTDQIADPKMIKCGDYVRAEISVVGNNPSESPGVYMNPSLFELYRAGAPIISENTPDAAAAFGAVPAQLPAGAVVDNSVVPGMALPPPPVTPKPEFLQPPKIYTVQGAQYTEVQLKGFGWTDAQIATIS